MTATLNDTIITVPPAVRKEIEDAAVAKYKEKVAAVAHKYATRHDWCSTVEDALEELGIESASREVSAQVTLTFTVTGMVERGNRSTIDEQYIRSSIAVDDSYDSGETTVAFGLDDDWNDQSWTFDYATVTLNE